jgi:hypothetical protein
MTVVRDGMEMMVRTNVVTMKVEMIAAVKETK